MSRAPRPFSTSARVHPSLLPHVQHPTRKPTRRWAIGLLSLGVAGYGARLCFEQVTEQRAAIEAKEREDAERRRRNAMLLDVYGDRESLEELEKAVQFYEQKK